MASPSTVLDWTPVEETLAAFRSEYAGLDGLVEELFGEVEKLREKLSLKAAEIERHRQDADDRRAALQQEREEHQRLAQQFEQQERQLSAALTLLEEVKHGLEEAPLAAASGDAETAQLQSERNSLRKERDKLQEERDALRSERDGIIAERESLRGEREVLRSERDAARLELEAARADAPHWQTLLAEIERFGGSLQERLEQPGLPAESREDAQQRSVLEQERAALLAELEQVRSRAAELHESLLQQQNERAEQNSRLLEELQQLRLLVERQSAMYETMPHAAGAPEAPAAEVELRGSDSAPAADPVVSSVMAQFAQLQKDVSRRRKRK